MVKNLTANAGDLRHAGLIPVLGISPGGGHGNPLQYSCLKNLTDREARWATVHRVAKSQTWLKQLNTAHSSANSVNLHRAVLSNFSLDIISSERSFLETVVGGKLLWFSRCPSLWYNHVYQFVIFVFFLLALGSIFPTKLTFFFHFCIVWCVSFPLVITIKRWGCGDESEAV